MASATDVLEAYPSECWLLSTNQVPQETHNIHTVQGIAPDYKVLTVLVRTWDSVYTWDPISVQTYRAMSDHATYNDVPNWKS